MSRPMRSPAAPPSRLEVLALGLTAAIGLCDLAYPLNGDQTLFALGGWKVLHGAALYRDFWDLKQPAVYAFYLAGEAMFGFGAAAVHLFELGHWLLFAILLVALLRAAFRDERFAALTPLLVVGGYYLGNSPAQLTQVEALAGFPLFIFTSSLVALANGRRERSSLAFVAGLAAGLTLLWKLLFAAVLIAIALALMTRALANGGFSRRDAVRVSAAGTAGLALPLLAFTVYAAVNHESALVWATFVTIPLAIARTIPGAPFVRLEWALRWFTHMYAALVLAAVVGIAPPASERNRAWRVALSAWVVGAALVISVQRQSWWEYHFDLFLVPVGILAAFGLETLLGWLAQPGVNGRRVACALFAFALAFFAGAPLGRAARNLWVLQRNDFALGAPGSLAYQRAVSEEAAEGIDAAAFLRAPASTPGDIYVAGDPTVYLYAGRNQAVALNGWSLEFFVDGQWHELYDELRTAAPPYVFVADVYRTTIPLSSPEIEGWLARHYRVAWQRRAGTWYARLASEQSAKRLGTWSRRDRVARPRGVRGRHGAPGRG